MSSAEPFDAFKFRNALGNFATGVTVVTAKDTNNGYVGTTASSFNSVSMDPPLILWSIDKGARALESYEQAEHFVVNVLAADQVSVSNHFARQQDDKFKDMDYSLSEVGVPVLSGCSAVFECKTAFQYEGGDHIIIVGEVLNFKTTDRNALLFHNGAYAVSEYHPVSSDRMISEEQKDESFAENYLPSLIGRSFYQLLAKLLPFLERQGIEENEYRVLASIAGSPGRTPEELQNYTVLQGAQLDKAVTALLERGLIADKDSLIMLTEKGQETIDPLIRLAKSNEADTLGHFNVEEALLLKSYLKRMVNWLS
nr:MoxB [uncultured bacterium]